MSMQQHHPFKTDPSFASCSIGLPPTLLGHPSHLPCCASCCHVLALYLQLSACCPLLATSATPEMAPLLLQAH